MFSRKLKHDEQTLLQRIEALVRSTVFGPVADPPQALEVLRLAAAIGAKLPEPLNPIVLTASALLHQLGAGIIPKGPAGGFAGASIAESFLRSTNLSDSERVQIVHAITAVGSPEYCPPETVEERALADAIQIEAVSMMGTLRALRSTDAPLGDFIKNERLRRKAVFERLHFEASRELGQPIFRQGEVFLKTLEQAYFASASRLKDTGLPS